MPRLSIPESERSKTRTVSCYAAEWKAIVRLVRAKMLHSPFDVVRFAISQSTDPKIVEERDVKKSFRLPRFASEKTLKHRRGRLSRAA